MPIINNNEVKKKNSSIINNISNSINNLLNLSYSKSNFTKPTNRDSLKITVDDINKSMDVLMANVRNNTGIDNLSVLYSKISSDEKEITSGLKNIFEDENNMDNLMGLYSQNKFIKELDIEIDTLCRYMPQLEEAINILKENVLASEQVNKEFLYMNNDSSSDENAFGENVSKMKFKYALEEWLDETYYRTAKYGEDFLYVVPYADAFTALSTKIGIPKKKMVVRENCLQIVENTMSNVQNNEKIRTIPEMENVSFTIEDDMLITEAAKNKKIIIKNTSITDPVHIKNAKDLYNGFKVDDGVMDDTKVDEIKKTDFNINGCLIKRLDREKVIPVYIDDVCLGYYYIECDTDSIEDLMRSNNDPTIHLKSSLLNKVTEEDMKSKVIKSIATSLAKTVDVNFINSHQDLKQEMYLLLKYYIDTQGGQKQFRITFLPREHVHHFYFKMDKTTHRGISDLYRSLVPGKLYASMYITNALAIITRGQDKRAYYVKQRIDTNISQLLLNTINQIKKSNFGMRDINNLNNFINVTGRFNDMVIPVGPSGESPIDFEIIQGQDVPIKTELMEQLESMAVNCTGIPIEAVQQRQNQIDFATQLTTTNTKILRLSYKRQTKFETQASPFLSDVYNCEYGGNSKIELLLPPPIYLSMQNTDMMFENSLVYAEKVAAVMYGDNNDKDAKEIDIFKNKIIKDRLNGVVPWDKYEKYKKIASIEYTTKYPKESQGAEE